MKYTNEAPTESGYYWYLPLFNFVMNKPIIFRIGLSYKDFSSTVAQGINTIPHAVNPEYPDFDKWKGQWAKIVPPDLTIE